MYFPKINKDDGYTVFTLCRNKMDELFDDFIPEGVNERLNDELSAMQKTDSSVCFLIAKCFAEESAKQGYPISSRGTVGSTLIAWLLGITDINPLKPHYYCDKCKHFDFAVGVADGYDLPNRHCPKCKAVMKGDGHNIPFHSLFGFDGDKIPDVDINVAPEVQAQAGDILRKLFPDAKIVRGGTTQHDGSRGVHPGGFFIIPAEHADNVPTLKLADGDKTVLITEQDSYDLHDTYLKMDILGHSTPEKLARLAERTGVDLAKIPMNDVAVMNMFQKASTNNIPEFDTEFVKDMLEICKPISFFDLCKISGLSHGTGVWIGNARALIEDGVAPLRDTLAFREDVFEMLTDCDMDDSEAFQIAEIVRKGKASIELEAAVFEEYNLPDWFYPSSRKIRYMFPKAHGVSYVKMAVQMMWFNVYHTDIFNAVTKDFE